MSVRRLLFVLLVTSVSASSRLHVRPSADDDDDGAPATPCRYVSAFDSDVSKSTCTTDCVAEVVAGSGTVRSPRDPYALAFNVTTYPPDADCTWYFRAEEGKRVRLAVSHFALEAPDAGNYCFDRLRVIDGDGDTLSSACGSCPPEVAVSSSHDLTVKFTSDENVEAAGFVLHFAQIEAPRAVGCSGGPRLLATPSGRIESDASRGDCAWHVRAGSRQTIELFVDEATSSDCPTSGVAVFDGATSCAPLLANFACGATSARRISSSGPNVYVQKRAFQASVTLRIRWKFVGSQTLDELPDEHPDELPDELPNEFPDEHPDVLPDELPDELPNELPDERPEILPDELRSGRPRLFPDEHSVNGSDLRACRAGVEVLVAPTGLIRSPGYPDSYPNDCIHFWLIQTSTGKSVRLRFGHVDLVSRDFRCRQDSLVLFDGQSVVSPFIATLCDHTAPLATLTSSGSDVLLMMVSDGQTSGSGFQVRWETIARQGNFFDRNLLSWMLEQNGRDDGREEGEEERKEDGQEDGEEEGREEEKVEKRNDGTLEFSGNFQTQMGKFEQQYGLNKGRKGQGGINKKGKGGERGNNGRASGLELSSRGQLVMLEKLVLFEKQQKRKNNGKWKKTGRRGKLNVGNSRENEVKWGFSRGAREKEMGGIQQVQGDQGSGKRPEEEVEPLAFDGDMIGTSGLACGFHEGFCAWRNVDSGAAGWRKATKEDARSARLPLSDVDHGDDFLMWSSSPDHSTSRHFTFLFGPILPPQSSDFCFSFRYSLSSDNSARLKLHRVMENSWKTGSVFLLWENSTSARNSWSSVNVLLSGQPKESRLVFAIDRLPAANWLRFDRQGAALDHFGIANGFCEKPLTCGKSVVWDENFDSQGSLARHRRVIGGVSSRQSEWPWLTRLRINLPTGGVRQCGGSLVSDRWILTAAHCFEVSRKLRIRNPRSIRAVLGEHDSWRRDKHEKVVFASKIVIHPNRTSIGVSPNDVALVRLSRPVSFKPEINRVCLPADQRDVFPAGRKCYVAGWGKIHMNGSLSTRPNHVQLDLVSFEYCQSIFGHYVDAGHQCAMRHDEVKASCKGDSGGPLVCSRGGQFTLTGVVSFGNPCGKSKRPLPSVFASVPYYLHWINHVIATS